MPVDKWISGFSFEIICLALQLNTLFHHCKELRDYVKGKESMSLNTRKKFSLRSTSFHRRRRLEDKAHHLHG
jgi:hypothetical protein